MRKVSASNSNDITRNASKAVSGTNAVNDLVGFWLLHSKATVVLSDWGPYVQP